jgi:type IV pilus assembly protein PilW
MTHTSFTHGIAARRVDRIVGATLVELMVSITIALIILAALAALFLTSRATYKYEEGMSRIQEGGRFATEFIAQDVRMAGFTGCLRKSTAINNHVNSTYAATYSLGSHLTGHTYVGSGGSVPASDWSPVLPADFATNEVEPYTDVITIRRSSESTVHLAQKMTPDATGDVVIEGNPLSLKQYDIVMIADCESGDMFQITDPATFATGATNNNIKHDTGAGTPGNSEQPLSKVFDVNTEIMKLTTRAYYIGRRGGNVTITTKPPVLFRKELTGGSFTSQELVEGVESMRVVFGVDSNNDNTADGYYRANALSTAAWQNVISARIGLLVQTTENVDASLDTKTYDVAGFTVNPVDDRRRRHVYTSTVQIRNP